MRNVMINNNKKIKMGKQPIQAFKISNTKPSKNCKGKQNANRLEVILYFVPNTITEAEPKSVIDFIEFLEKINCDHNSSKVVINRLDNGSYADGDELIPAEDIVYEAGIIELKLKILGLLFPELKEQKIQ